MRILYFDCFSGISGDMVLGAVVHAGAPLAELEAQLRRLPLRGWQISAEAVKRKGLAATQVRVTAGGQHHHRGLRDILELIDAADLAPRVTQRARTIFECLGAAEARAHAVPIEKVHFHEVGAVDAIVDVVGACIGFELLGIEEFACSPINVGGGTVQTAHGVLPVPAPATADLLRAAPTYSSGILGELATPTGAAILAGTTRRYGPQPGMTVSRIGHGAGSAELAEQANLLRILVGEAAGPALELESPAETLLMLETNLDDMSPQLYGYLSERALAAGALDVFTTPVMMKKGRPGHLLSVLCAPERAGRLAELLFRETTTLGVRATEVRRWSLERELCTVETPHGAVRIKLARAAGQIVNAQPEYEDCRRIAEAKGLPLKQVMAEALYTFQAQQRASRD